MASICPQLLTSGTCSVSSCPLLHDIQFCDLCGVTITSPAVQAAHFGGKAHRQRLLGTTLLLWCTLCNTAIFAYQWAPHTSSPKHVSAAKLKGVPPSIDGQKIVTDIQGYKYCDQCRTHTPKAQWKAHTKARGHQRQERFSKFKAALNEAERDKHGLTIEGPTDFDIIAPSVSSAGTVLSLVIKMAIPHSKVTLVSASLVSGRGNRISPFAIFITSPNRTVSYGTPIQLKVTFQQAHIGRYEDRAEILFEDIQLHKRFIISRTLRAVVGSKEDHQLLRPIAPYVPRERLARQREVKVVPGVDPPSLKAIPYVFKLPQAKIPEPLISTLSLCVGPPSEDATRVKNVFLPSVLNSDTYARHFKYLLWIEEFRMDRDMERYDMEDARLNKHGKYYYLKVPGLAEKRPSVLVGDRILVQKRGTTQGHWFEGRVHVVRQAEVGLQFHHSFGWSAAQQYNVRFKLARVPMRRQHQAMDTAFSQSRILFPVLRSDTRGSHRPYPRTGLQLYNALLANNPPQLKAVNAIVHQTPGSLPFVVFGPPGTGKTITIVEAIQQVLKSNPRAKILACAPSNSAADLIALRLSALSVEELFRFYAPSRSKDQVPDKLHSYTYIRREDGLLSVPPVATMKRFRVVVTTCVSASVVSGIGIPRGHYSHIFIDEAGQATEPEAFVSIKTMADNSTNIILSGDPKQLGPIVRSGIARELGLEISYLERLMATDAYDPDTGHGLSVKLVKNFRSHNAILKFPNMCFYNGDLQQCGYPRVINSYLGSSYLPSKQFPVLFHGIYGKDEREVSSPSFFNVDEASQVKKYVQALRSDRVFRTTDGDIGIITPYHAQCLKIRTILKDVGDGIKVGSVEEFQGQERRVIIISTVRSSREFVEYDLRHTLGFVANPRRFNVAVTRAQALLIIIGDPQVLSLDPLWRSFLNYIHENNGWMGQPITWDPSVPVEQAGGYDRTIREAAEVDMNDFTRRIETLTLSGEDEANVDRPWRDLE